MIEFEPPYEIGDTSFLKAWLDNFEAEHVGIERHWASVSADDKEAAALAAGFRTFRSARECNVRMHLVLRGFVKEEAFHTLWLRLSQSDALAAQDAPGTIPAVSPANGGFPHRLLRSIVGWYQLPRLTAKERVGTLTRMSKLTTELSDLLGTLSPDGDMDPFLAISGIEERQAGKLFAGIGVTKASYEKSKEKPGGSTWRARFALQDSGITPAFVLQGLQRTIAVQLDQPRTNKLPTKIRAAGAMKTHFIKRLEDLLRDATVFSPKPPKIEAQLIAEIVSIVANTDCSAEDVYKAGFRANFLSEGFDQKPNKSSQEKS